VVLEDLLLNELLSEHCWYDHGVLGWVTSTKLILLASNAHHFRLIGKDVVLVLIQEVYHWELFARHILEEELASFDGFAVRIVERDSLGVLEEVDVGLLDEAVAQQNLLLSYKLNNNIPSVVVDQEVLHLNSAQFLLENGEERVLGTCCFDLFVDTLWIGWLLDLWSPAERVAVESSVILVHQLLVRQGWVDLGWLIRKLLIDDVVNNKTIVVDVVALLVHHGDVVVAHLIVRESWKS